MLDPDVRWLDVCLSVEGHEVWNCELPQAGCHVEGGCEAAVHWASHGWSNFNWRLIARMKSVVYGTLFFLLEVGGVDFSAALSSASNSTVSICHLTLWRMCQAWMPYT